MSRSINSSSNRTKNKYINNKCEPPTDKVNESKKLWFIYVNVILLLHGVVYIKSVNLKSIKNKIILNL